MVVITLNLIESLFLTDRSSCPHWNRLSAFRKYFATRKYRSSGSSGSIPVNHVTIALNGDFILRETATFNILIQPLMYFYF